MTASREYEAIAELVDQIEATSTELRAVAADAELPAVERNAKRLEATVWVLQQHVPPEVIDEHRR